MKNMFDKFFSHSIDSDLYKLLTVDINSKAVTHKKSRDEIYADDGNHLEIVGMNRGRNLFRRLLSTRKFEVLNYKQNITLGKEGFLLKS